jgi:CRISPR-associated endonuclease/helicase Cas3
MADTQFTEYFRRLTGQDPFPWQKALYGQFASGDIPSACDLPTGLGKTSVIAVWLIALILHPEKMPRRLVYVVNRRTVVDQTTLEVERLREGLLTIDDRPAHASELAISTLRGQFADNRAWSADPSRPAVICGTVDMIGSRLLFSGYGVGFKAKPLHAGFLGQDALLVHDEAHLEPAFQKLVEGVVAEQKRCQDWWPLRVMALSATARTSPVNGHVVKPFELTDDERNPPTTLPSPAREPIHHVWQRLKAKKALILHEVSEGKDAVSEKIAEIALGKHKESEAAVLIFVRTLDDVKKVCDRLIDKKKGVKSDHVQQLTGTMRGLERDALASSDPVFHRFLPKKSRNPAIVATEGTVYLVSTNAGEVGVDISADHLVCDLSTFESMAQRFGRVNRYGDREDTRIDVVYPEEFVENDKLTPARKATLELLGKLQGDASPLNLGTLDGNDRQAAFAPTPTVPLATDILFDTWALTSIRQPLPGRPPVEPYLHGIAEWEPPQTRIAWREEVEIVTGDLLRQHSPADLLDDYPLKPHELLRDRSDRVFKHIEALAHRHAEKPAWILDGRESVEATTLAELADKRHKERLDNCTILLPPSIGGLTGGMLDGDSHQAEDVSDISEGPSRRVRVHPNDSEFEAKIAMTAGMRRIRSIVLADRDDGDQEPCRWEWYESVSLEGGRTATRPVILKTHVDDVVTEITRIVACLSIPPTIANALILAARLHDHGKRRERFQFTLGNRQYPVVLLAKSGKKGARLPEPFRHEFASLLDAQLDETFRALDSEMKDLVLHLIAAHHGRARPHFDTAEAFDPEASTSDTEALAIEVPRRFARLQRKYGRWGLAYLESLLRAADWTASAKPSAYVDEPGRKP